MKQYNIVQRFGGGASRRRNRQNNSGPRCRLPIIKRRIFGPGGDWGRPWRRV